MRVRIEHAVILTTHLGKPMNSEISPQLLRKIQSNTRRTDLGQSLSTHLSAQNDDAVSTTVQLMADTDDSKFELAQAYMTGKGARRRPEVAARLLEQLAEKGYIKAQKTLGKAHSQNNIPSTSVKEQFYWYAKAAQAGDAESQYQLAVMYAKGEGRERNLPLAAMWIAKAAKQEHLEALHGLGWMLLQGEGVKQDSATALSMFYRAAIKEHVDSQLLLGKLYFKGEMAPLDYKMAEHWLTLASNKGCKDAYCLLGKMHRDGLGVERSLEKALSLFIEGVKRGSTEAAEAIMPIAEQYAADSISNSV